MALIGTYTYEEGTNGASVTTGNGIIFVGGTVTYSAAYAHNGALGILLDPTSTPTIDYAITLPQTGSVYIKRGPETPSTRVNQIVFINDSATTAGAIGIKKTGEWILQDSAGNLLQTSTYVTAPGDSYRIDWQVSYSGGTLSWTAKFFASPDSSTATETLTATATSVQPTRTRFITFNGASLGVDTLRLWDDVAAWPDPYASGTGATISWLRA